MSTTFWGSAALPRLSRRRRCQQRVARFDAPVMALAALVLLVFLASGRRLSRTEGAALVAAYLLYVAMLWPG